jgi:hypothetical protein
MRIHLIYGAIIVALIAYLFAPASPQTFLECRENAARTAKSKEAMYVLIGVCRERFPEKPPVSASVKTFIAPRLSSFPAPPAPAAPDFSDVPHPYDPSKLDFSTYGVPVDRNK